jgi:hypothetical protein
MNMPAQIVDLEMFKAMNETTGGTGYAWAETIAKECNAQPWHFACSRSGRVRVRGL